MGPGRRESMGGSTRVPVLKGLCATSVAGRVSEECVTGLRHRRLFLVSKIDVIRLHSRAGEHPPMTPPALKRQAADAAEKNRPLVEDIRLLGRILGDVIREQEGKDAFELIERVRKLSVAYRLKSDAQAGRALDRLLKNLSGDQTVI